MSANDSALENWLAQSLDRRLANSQNNNQDKKTAPKPAANGLSDTDRMIALIEAATATFDPTDAKKVEAVFAGQTVALDVIFNEFIRRRTCLFDSMRVALRAQAQCRSTFKSLADFNNPRRPSTTAPERPVRRSSQSEGGNSSEQTIENAEIRA